MKIHPLCELFPAMDDDQYAALEQDIIENGIIEPVVVHNDMIVDGRHRWRIAHEQGIECQTVKWRGKESNLLKWIVSKNLHRRHLTTSQRAALAADIAKRPHGDQGSERPIGRSHESPKKSGLSSVFASIPTQTEAAKMMNVGERTVRRAAAVKDASPKKHEQVKRGEKTVQQAEREIREEAKPKPTHDVHDEIGKPVRPKSKLAAAYDSIGLLTEAQSSIQQVRQKIKAIADAECGAYLDAQQIDIDLKNAWSALKFARPHTTCPECGGDGCKVCRKRGWVPKPVYERCSDESRAAWEKSK